MAIEITEEHFPALLQLFFDTYPFYYDRHSRHSVQRCIRTIFSKDASPDVLSPFVKTIQAEANKPGIAPSNAFVLVEWYSVLLQEISGTKYWEKWGLDVVSSDAQVLDLCHSTSSRHNVRHSAIITTRRALRKIFSHKSTRQQYIDNVVVKLTAKGGQSLARNAVMLGVVAGVCARKEEAKPILDAKKPDIYGFYTREILGSRTPIPAHIANGLCDFFSSFTTSEDVESQLVPSLEKGLLRAPEIILNDLVTPLFQSFSHDIDLSRPLCDRLLKPLLSNIKSSNAAIRNGAMTAFKAAISRSHSDEPLCHIAEEILNPLKLGKLSAADQRALHSEMLAAIPISEELAGKVLPSLAAVAAKEANEVALSSETLVLMKYTTWSLKKDLDVGKEVTDAFSKGLADKKASFRRLWGIRLGEVLWAMQDVNMSNPSLVKISEAVFPGLLETWTETIANPLAAAQSGLVTTAYVLTALASNKLELLKSGKTDAGLKKARITEQALTFENKPSYLLNHRIYVKLANDDDLIWFIRALAAVCQRLTSLESNSPVAIAWSQAMIFCVCSSSLTPAVRRRAAETLSGIYVQWPFYIAEVMTRGLWRWLQCIAISDKDSAAAATKFESGNLHLVARSICLPPAEAVRLGTEVDVSTRERQMVSMLVISRPELLPNVQWIDLCLRVEVDPGNLARRYDDALIDEILQITDFNETVRFPKFYCRLHLTFYRCP